MALRISVDLDGLRWADLFRFVDLARNGGISAEDQVDVITYGSDPMSVSLSARIYPASEGFLSTEQPEPTPESLRGAPLSISPGSAGANGSGFAYEGSADRSPAANGNHYPAFDNGQDRATPPNGNGLASYGPGYDSPTERGVQPAAGGHYPAFDGQPDRMPPAPGGGQFAGFETFDRSAAGKEPGGAPGQVESPYIEEFARLQEGLMRQVRRTDEVRPDRS